jgi:protein transport protein SEC20
VKAFRRAQLSAKQSLEEAQRKERKLLLQSYANPLPPDSTPATSPKRRNQQLSEPSKDEKTINASTDVTLALRRTHDLMASELSRSQFAHDTLQQSTAALAQLSENYSTLDTLLSSSKNLLGTLLRSQKSDTWYLETAFYVLLATIAWLVFRRFIYGPAWWLLWFPVKIFWKSTASALGVTGLVGSTNHRSRAIITHNKDTRNPISTTADSEFSKTNIGDNSQETVRASTNVPLGGGSVSEQVGQMVDKNRDGAGDQKAWVTGNNEAAGGDAASRNPMKRMWEADKEARQEVERKDEL